MRFCTFNDKKIFSEYYVLKDKQKFIYLFIFKLCMHAIYDIVCIFY